MNDLQIKKAVLSFPGDTLKEHLAEIGMSPKELAEKIGLSVNVVNKIITGHDEITPHIASLLESVLNISANFWLNLEKICMAEIAEIEKLDTNATRFNIIAEMEKEKNAEFEKVTRAAIKYLCENHHPPATLIITPTGAELTEGLKCTGPVYDYLID